MEVRKRVVSTNNIYYQATNNWDPWTFRLADMGTIAYTQFISDIMTLIMSNQRRPLMTSSLGWYHPDCQDIWITDLRKVKRDFVLVLGFRILNKHFLIIYIEFNASVALKEGQQITGMAMVNLREQLSMQVNYPLLSLCLRFFKIPK